MSMTPDLKKRVGIYVAVIVVALIFLIPTFFNESFKDRSWISKPISLGLDLSGGVYLAYEVEAEEAVKSRLQGTALTIKRDLRKEKIAITRTNVVTPVGANPPTEFELTFLNDRVAEKAKDLIEDEYGKVYTVKGQSEDAKGRVTVRYGISERDATNIMKSAVDQAIETLRNRVDQFGVAEPLIQKVGNRRIILQMPGVSDVDSVKKVVGSVAKLEFRFRPNSQTRAYQVMIKDMSGNDVPVEDEVQMTGDAVDDARVAHMNNQMEVSLTLTADGARTFRKITTDGVGRELSIILDGVEYSAPRINEPIAGGRASITGHFSAAEAKQLAIVLRAGALPAPLKVLEERTVGPTLGKESIEKGITAILVGFLLIIVFMVVYYKKSGVVASSALILNLLLVMAALSAFGATLTLPGLAGLALTVGMAVDANVIIFERIREELRNGAGRSAAVQSGFGKALSAIIDSNLTTLLAGLILYYFGSGPIRGFAVTLSIGILTTIYCATFVARLGFDVFRLEGKNQQLSI